MIEEFKNIKVLIWDIDGTFYKMTPEIHAMYREREYKVIMVHTGWSREKAIAEFNKVYKIQTPSGTKTAAILSGIPVAQAAIETETFMEREKYLGRDEKLVTLFQKLQPFTHYMLVNGIQSMTKKILIVLGLHESLFQEIVTSEVVGENKPSEKGFQYILEKTGLAPEEHMMIGDRIDVDLVPAKKLGMKTCLVWSEEKSEVSDMTLKTVYDVAGLLL